MAPKTMLAFAAALAIILLATPAASHAICTSPRQRGAIREKADLLMDDLGFAQKLNQDWKPHFPAGDKNASPGSGKRSQDKAGGAYVPFDPYSPTYRWRAGVCGDMVNGKEHLKGGEYYNDGLIVANYKQGQVVEMESTIIAHHNGYYMFFICDIDRCTKETPSDDISPECFQKGYCKTLMRAPDSDCDNGMSKMCGPIDPAYPGRWYLPCGKGGSKGNSVERFGGRGGHMKYKLPDDLACKHCVILWHYVAANSCMPIGLKDYFEGPYGPKNWGQCIGQGGAIGGYPRGGDNWERKKCQGSDSPEEYYQCADVSIDGDGSAPNPPPPTPSPPTIPPTTVAITEPPTVARTTQRVADPPATDAPVTAAPTTTARRTAAPATDPLVTDAPVTDAPAPPPPAQAEGMYVDIIPAKQNAKDAGVRASDGDAICPSDYADGFTLACKGEPEGTRSVTFFVNDLRMRTERVAPYVITGDYSGRVNAWRSYPDVAKVKCETDAGDSLEVTLSFKC